jgi:hypothetical protein
MPDLMAAEREELVRVGFSLCRGREPVLSEANEWTAAGVPSCETGGGRWVRGTSEFSEQVLQPACIMASRAP